MAAPMSKVCVMGLGYIGLPTAAVLASHGHQVHGVDIHSRTVDAVNAGRPLIEEPGLTELVASCVSAGSLAAGLTPCQADVFMITVPTPFKDGNVPDLTYVEAALDAIAPCLRPDNLLILESTSPVGTTAGLAERLQALRPDLVVGEASRPRLFTDKRVHLAYCAERVFPGQILRELTGNDRIVGGLDAAASERAQKFYRTFATGNVHATDAGTAEMCKLTENSFRDVNIAFANELSRICADLGLDVWKVVELANSHPRVNVLRPGPGVGGHCIAVDPWFIVHSSPEQARIIRTAREINDEQPSYVVKQVRECCAPFETPTIACLGLTFKANVDDVRESPAMTVVEELSAARLGNLVVADPKLTELPKRLRTRDVEWTEAEAAVSRADIVVLLVDHDEFRSLDRELLSSKAVVDTRGMWRDLGELRERRSLDFNRSEAA